MVKWKEGRPGSSGRLHVSIRPPKGIQTLAVIFFTLPLFQVREQAKNQNGHVDGQRNDFVHRHLAYLPYLVFRQEVGRVRETTAWSRALPLGSV